MDTKLSRRHFLTTALAGTAAAVAAPHVARAQSYKSEYKLSLTNDRPTPYAVASFQMAEKIAEKTNGRIKIKVYPQSQLVAGDAVREFPSLRRGVFDFLTVSTINLVPHVREMGLFSLPFLMSGSRDWDAVVASDVRKDLEASLTNRDTVTLAWSENGFRQINNSKRDIRTPADLRGLKIRYAANPMNADIFNALGANPVQMSWADHLTALSTGAVDGSENPFSSFVAAKLWLMNQRHMSVWNYSTDAMLYTVNSEVWKTFSPQDRDIIKAAADEAALFATTESRKGLGLNGDRSVLDLLAQNNVNVLELTPEEKAAFRNATKDVMAKWAPQVGDDLVKKAQAALSKAS
jgi:tripartite ATP-independent transporter DctP family solute receptor